MTTDSSGGPAPTGTPVPTSAFRYRSYQLFWAGRLASTFAVQIVAVAVAWQIYDLTRDPLDLGIVGLVQFLPAFLLVLVTGQVADRFSRRRIMSVCLAVEAVGAAALLLITWGRDDAVWPIFVVLFVFGVARAFFAPASSSLVPNLVPPEALSHAITWSSSSWQLASIVGPVVGGLLYDVSPEIAYVSALALLLVGSVLVAMIRAPQVRTRGSAVDLASVLGGFRYIWRQKIVLGAISLDLFAVLLGGAVALLPAIARDVLHAGPLALGILRGAPGIGAIGMAFALSMWPIRDRAGHILFVAVAIFGLAIVAFGLSTTIWLSVIALFVMGAADMISVVVRETLLQLWTPDALRGRVNAVNNVFLGASNELGEFRAGVSAALFGVIPAIVAGGVGTVIVAGLWAYMFPGLRTARRLDAPESPGEALVERQAEAPPGVV